MQLSRVQNRVVLLRRNGAPGAAIPADGDRRPDTLDASKALATNRGLTFEANQRKVAVFKMKRKPAQLSLTLRAPRRWGGARAGAGRKPGNQPGVRHAARAAFRRTVPAHVTLRLRPDLPSLRNVRVVCEIERTFAIGCDRPGFRLVHYSLQGNHAHLIVEARDQVALGRGMMAIGARLARALNRVSGRTGHVLAERYHHRLLATPKEVHTALRYVLLNARKHAAKARAALRWPARLDPASSARWFDGWKPGHDRVPTAVDDAPAASPPPIARARTWLLTVGWRRHGLLDPAAVPS